MMDTKPITELSEALDAMWDARVALRTGMPFVRGQADAAWSLVPSVFRGPDTSVEREHSLLYQFMNLAPARHARCPAPGDIPRWLFLAQHYRLHTRLLDWSESPLVALFFAVVEEDRWDTDGALWALNAGGWNEAAIGEIRVATSNSKPVKQLIGEAMKPEEPTTELVVALGPEEIDPRMLAQQAMMTMHGSKTPLEAMPGSEKHLRRYVIPADRKEFIKGELELIGIRHRTLFPDLHYLALDLSEQTYGDDPMTKRG